MPDQNIVANALIPTTDVYDVEAIYSLDIQSQDFKEFLVRLRQSTNNIAIAVNYRDAGLYVEELFICGQQYFANKTLSSGTRQTPTYRSVYRKVVDFGALPNAAAKIVAHDITNIDAQVTFTRIYATATDPVAFNYIPIPIAFVGGNIIDLQVDAVNVTITTNFNATNFTRCFVVLEFIKG